MFEESVTCVEDRYRVTLLHLVVNVVGISSRKEEHSSFTSWSLVFPLSNRFTSLRA
jgi:hypothetical protein